MISIKNQLLYKFDLKPDVLVCPYALAIGEGTSFALLSGTLESARAPSFLQAQDLGVWLSQGVTSFITLLLKIIFADCMVLVSIIH